MSKVIRGQDVAGDNKAIADPAISRARSTETLIAPRSFEPVSSSSISSVAAASQT